MGGGGWFSNESTLQLIKLYRYQGFVMHLGKNLGGGKKNLGNKELGEIFERVLKSQGNFSSPKR